MIKKLLLFIGFSVIVLGGFFVVNTTHTQALSSGDWQPGDIIDDATFTDANSMSPADIQNFLNAKDPSCDTWGTQPATEWGRSDITHAQYAALQGWAGPPYVCLKNYVEVPKTSPSAGVPDNSYNHYNASTKTLLPVPGGLSAAQIIYNAAQQYQISPKILLIKIQTESAGPLTQDTWPLQSQYTYALGSNCPDSGPGGSAQCDPNYSGFSMQVYSAASLLRTYLTNMTQSWWTHATPYKNNAILWNVTQSNCGSGNVYISTKATAALYTYTPYQPNAAALANVSSTYSGGTGNSCSAYGNRNFWWWYNNWFGSPHTIPGQCDATVPNETCVWELMQTDGEYFYTTSLAERDASIKNGFNYVGVAFYARTANDSNSDEVPEYRLQKAGQHFWTTSTQLRQQYLSSGWSDEGIAWYTDPSSSNTGNPMYKLLGPDGNYLYVRSDEYNTYINQGYTYANETINTPTKYIPTSVPPSGSYNVYRLNTCNSGYMFTTSIPEVEAIIKDSCNKYEGVAFYATSNTTTSTPVNRFSNNGRYIWTTSQAETTSLSNGGWTFEGVAFYVDNNSGNDTPVNRFSNNGHYIWTTSQAEVASLAKAGWTYEGIAFYTTNTNSSSTPVNRFSNNGHYIWTTSQAEVASLAKAGWTYEGIAFYTDNDNVNGTPVNRLSYNGSYIWTTSQAEVQSLSRAGWTYEGIAFYTDNDSSDGTPVNRFSNNGRYIWTISQAEATSLSNAGWTREGIAFYVND